MESVTDKINPQQAHGSSSLAPIYDKSAEKTEKDFDSMPIKKKPVDWYCSFFGKNVYQPNYWREPWRIRGERITVFRFYKGAILDKYSPFDVIIDWPRDMKQARERAAFFNPDNYAKACLMPGIEDHPCPVYWFILPGEIDDDAIPRLTEALRERFGKEEVKANVEQRAIRESAQAKKKRS